MGLKQIGAVFFLILFTCLFFSQAVFSGKIFLFHDLLSFHYPVKAFYSAALKDFNFPLWFPHAGCGVPLLAEAQGAFMYPLNILLFFLLPLDTAFKYSIILHYLLAALFMFLFVRSLGRSCTASTLSAVIFAFSGFFVTHLHHMNFILVGAWLPLLFWCIQKYYEREKISYIVMAILVLSNTYLAGHPQMAFYSFLAVFLFYLFKIWVTPGSVTREGGALYRLGPLVLILVLPIALAAIQVLPTFELFSRTERIHADAAFAGEASYHPLQYLTFLFPGLFGKISPADVPGYGWMSPGYWGPGGAYWEMCGYAGVATLVLVIFLLFINRERMSYFFFFLLFMSGLMILGKYLPFYWFHVKTPLLSSFRFPCRYLYLATFSLAVLAGTGLDALAAETQRARRDYSRIFLIVVLMFLIFLLGCHAILKLNKENFLATGDSIAEQKIRNLPQHSLQAGKYGQRVKKIYESLVRVTNPLSTETLQVFGWILATLILLFLFRKKRVKAGTFRAGLLAIIAADLFIFGHGYNPVTSSTRSAPPPAARVLLQDTDLFRLMPVYRRADPEREVRTLKAVYGSIYGLNYLFFPSPLLMRENRRLVEAAGGALHPFPPEEKLARIRENLDLFGMLNVKYILSDRSIEDERLEKVDESDVYVYRNRAYMPRAFIVPSASYVPEDKLLEALLDPAYDPAQTVFLPDRPPSLSPRIRMEKKDVRFTEYTPDRVALETDTDRDAFLVMTDNFFPGWTAFVDGEEVTTYRANLAFRAVIIPEGRHEVLFRYRPHSFVIGRALSGFSLIILFVIFFYPISPFKSRSAYRSHGRFR